MQTGNFELLTGRGIGTYIDLFKKGIGLYF